MNLYAAVVNSFRQIAFQILEQSGVIPLRLLDVDEMQDLGFRCGEDPLAEVTPVDSDLRDNASLG